MLKLEEKINYLEKTLNKDELDFNNNFKSDIYIYFDEFNLENQRLQFLKNIISLEEIDFWIEKLISKLALKFDSETEQINDFIYDFIELG